MEVPYHGSIMYQKLYSLILLVVIVLIAFLFHQHSTTIKQLQLSNEELRNKLSAQSAYLPKLKSTMGENSEALRRLARWNIEYRPLVFTADKAGW